MGLLSKLTRGGGALGPLELLPSLLAAMPDAHRIPLLELHELVAGAGHLGPPDAPAWSASLWKAAGRDAGLSPELLAAIAWTRSRFDPAADGGLLGVPRSVCPWPAATLTELEGRSEAALERVRAGVMLGARKLQELRKATPGALGPALVAFVALGGAQDPRAAAGEVASTFAHYLARRSQGEKLETLSGVIQEAQVG